MQKIRSLGTYAKLILIVLVIIEQVSILYGDIDGNSAVTARDAAMLYAYLRGTYSLSEEQLACADVDGNGTITARDAAMLYAYLRGTLTSFPAQVN